MAQGQAGSVPRVRRLWSRAMPFKKALEGPAKEMDSVKFWSFGSVKGTWGEEALWPRARPFASFTLEMGWKS